jgi:hypothetical protein
VPPKAPRANIGTALTRPSTPTQAEEWVASKICRIIAKDVIVPPMEDRPDPTHSRPKAGYSRNGPVSIRRLLSRKRATE